MELLNARLQVAELMDTVDELEATCAENDKKMQDIMTLLQTLVRNQGGASVLPFSSRAQEAHEGNQE